MAPVVTVYAAAGGNPIALCSSAKIPVSTTGVESVIET
jgi:hypothetical protein